ncbi:MAG: hypothetical protein ACRCU2_15845 [Planktothrix sp.]
MLLDAKRWVAYELEQDSSYQPGATRYRLNRLEVPPLATGRKRQTILARMEERGRRPATLARRHPKIFNEPSGSKTLIKGYNMEKAKVPEATPRYKPQNLPFAPIMLFEINQFIKMVGVNLLTNTREYQHKNR